ncbi:hypothetical protein FA15DRAFT_490308 [Coprinopsis marcescibilis]|uniref:Copper transport protein n=1 Tax=Coprinopsis marcescibilis TaxID=230819 RepID=A0A5C3KRE0_COPMA|nr:hypothetical protein FA15DRAFT_490308 [Coprinopsis marcescibilis]
MDHSDHGSTGGADAVVAASGHAMMIPYFHVTTGDHLLFKEWVPSSPGAIAGACIGLFLLAVIERWTAAMRTMLEHHWKHRALLLSSRFSPSSDKLSASRTSSQLDKVSSKHPQPDNSAIEEATTLIPSVLPRLRLRTIPPFVPSQDISRGIIHAFHSALGFLMMLALM